MWLGGQKGIEKMRLSFDNMDTDGSGTISADELRVGLSQTSGMMLEGDEISLLMKMLDTNGLY
jgi:Ca2+-binding EF-hand superfamily protein